MKKNPEIIPDFFFDIILRDSYLSFCPLKIIKKMIFLELKLFRLSINNNILFVVLLIQYMICLEEKLK